ncbi:MAG TPA: circadian clock KaiB family protein [Chitinophagaceae bacterium]|jgi:circadian clock protein KaiB|nr:circadian clock KaiB family protein [Chitinophagaceae bacterium]
MEKKKSPYKEKELGSAFIFRLYVTGASPNSSRAISNVKNLFETHLKDQYELNIIDVYQQPQVAKTVDIIALPLLVRKMPLPERRLIGDMSDHAKVIKSLGL